MTKPELILVGAGGHARACLDVIERQGEYRIAGLVASPEEKDSLQLGYPVIASDEELPALAKAHMYALVAVGQIRSPDKRIRIFQRLMELGFLCPTIVSPKAYVSRHAVIGAGTIVMHGAIVNAGARVGSNCIINSRALIEHDVTVADHCHVSTGALVNGGASIGAGSFVGSGCVIREGICLGQRCVIGMGVAVRHDQTDDCQFVESGKS